MQHRGELTYLRCADRLLREGLKSVELAADELAHEPADYGKYCQLQLVVANLAIVRGEVSMELAAMRKRNAA